MNNTNTTMSNREVINLLIGSTKGKFFSISFIKKNGKARNMTARTGVKKGLTGKGSSYGDEAKSQYITLYDVVNRGYRAVNRDTIKTLRVCGHSYIVE
jgi:hypothetical protein